MGSRKMDGHQEQLNRIERKLDQQAKTLDEHSRVLEDHGRKLDEHGRKLDEHGRKLDEHDRKLDGHDRRMDRIDHRVEAVEDALGEFRAEVDARFDEVTASLKRLELTQTTILGMMTRFLGDVGEARRLERRVKRLEDSVFGRKG